MSAWVVNDQHIDVLVKALMDRGLCVLESADETGQMLWQANYDSVNCRYREDTPTPEYKYQEPTGKYASRTDIETFNDLRCYDYQSCEVPDWNATEAYRLIDALGKTLDFGRLNDDQVRETAEWENAGWGVDPRPNVLVKSS